MDYSRLNTEHTRGKIRSGAAKAEKKIAFNILRFVVIIIIIAGISVIAAIVGGFHGIIDSAPKVSIDEVMPSKVKSVMYYPDGKKAVELVGSQSNRTIISIDDLPKTVPEAFIAIEDQRFYEHNGIDPKGIIRALFVGISSKGNFSQGASTITQQLIKLTIFGGGEESNQSERFKRKFQEWYMSIQLEKQLSKDEILEAYLNTINLGRGAYGIEAAAERYFDKSAKDLTVSESAVIAAIAQAPSNNNPINGQKKNSQRRQKILENMLSLGYITQDEYDEAENDDVYSRIQKVNEEKQNQDTIYTWFEDACIDQVISDLQTKLGYTKDQATSAIYSGGLQIYMTEDKDIQAIVDKYYKDDSNFSSKEYLLDWALTYKNKKGKEVNVDENSLQSYYGSDKCDLLYDSKEQAQQAVDDYKKALGVKDSKIVAETFNAVVQSQSSFVIMDQHNGHVLAISGGRGEKTENRSFNRATQATRQPGSVFKVLAVYSAALDSCGLTLASTKVDEPYTTPDGYEVFNTNAKSYKGTVTMRQAITNSMNVVTVKWMVENVTPALGIQYLEKYGFTTIDKKNDNYAPLALGGIYKGVSNLEVTGAFAAIANGGVYTEPIFYTRILDKDGNVLLENVPETHRVIKDSTAWLLTSAMEDVVSKGTGTAAKISNSGIAEAGKTGTTENYTDLWFAGFTPYYTAAIWLGYDSSTSMRGRISYNYTEHKTLWKNIMNEVLQGKADADFTVPDSVQKVTVCSKSGLLPQDGCPTITEYLAKDTIPTDYCTDHSTVAVEMCSHCGKRATSYTPKEYVYTEYFDSADDVPDEYCEDVAVDESDENGAGSSSSGASNSSSSSASSGSSSSASTAESKQGQ